MEKDIDLKVKAQGPMGPQGERGPQGPQGARGDLGYNFYYSTYEASPNQNSMYWTDLQPVANPPRVGEHVVMPSGKVYQITEVNNNASPKTYGIGELLADLHGIQGPKGDKGDAGEVDEKLASIFGKGQNLVALNVYWTNWDDNKRQYAQLSIDQMKTSIDEAANYVQGIVVPLRLENDGNQFHVLGNLADIKQGIDYAASKGLKLMSVKIHCVATLEQITNYGIDNFFNDYANSVAAACTSLGATSDVKLTILNERWDLVNDEKYADKVVKLINDLKTATKLSVGISFVQQYLGDAQSAVYSACDFIGLNAYPTVTDLKRSVPFALIASAWQQVAPIIQSLIALYHKPIFFSEIGIEDNYEALEDPSNWNVGSQYNSQGEVQYMYFKGLIESGILDYTTEMWIWFGITSSKAQALLRQYMNGVIN